MKILFALSVLVLCGCEPCAHYNRLQTADFFAASSGNIRKKPYGSVTPFFTVEEVKTAYKPIGYMSCEGNLNEEGAILHAMLYRAADMGADGIILNPLGIGQSTASTNPRINVEIGWAAVLNNGNGNRCIYRAQAIQFIGTNAAPNGHK